MLIFQFDQEKLDSQDININPEVLAFWNGYIEQSKNGFVLLPPYINYVPIDSITSFVTFINHPGSLCRKSSTIRQPKVMSRLSRR